MHTRWIPIILKLQLRIAGYSVAGEYPLKSRFSGILGGTDDTFTWGGRGGLRQFVGLQAAETWNRHRRPLSNRRQMALFLNGTRQKRFVAVVVDVWQTKVKTADC